MASPASSNGALDEFIAPIIGLPVWGVKQGYGSFLNLEFGAPELIVQEYHSTDRGFRRHAYVSGRWHIWIYCCEWQISVRGERIALSEDSRDDIDRAAGMIDGQKLVLIDVDAKTGKSCFEFDLGGRLETWPSGDDATEEQWFIYAPGEVFAYRADGYWCKQSPDTAREDEQWHPMD